MPHTIPLPQTTPTKTSTIDLKANGEASRMRNHRGNMPSLPQTKYCALCPAKFTRTTHLNRHLRSHTNERAHRCSSCNAEFTRSDLLTRHKRTCGDAYRRNANKSRRKSCQACAESKVKCNLEQPCSKCFAKGKECVFINDPGASRHKKGLGRRRSPSSTSPCEAEGSECSLMLDSSSPSSMISHLSHDVDSMPSHLISPYHSNPQYLSKAAFGLSGVSSFSDGSSAGSSRSSPQLDSFDPRQNAPNAFSASFDTMELDSDLSNLFPTTLDPYIEDPFKFSSCLPRIQSEPDVSPWSEFNQTCSAYGAGGPYDYSHVNHEQSFVSGTTNLTTTSFSKAFYSRQPFCSHSTINLNAPNSASSAATTSPTAEELNQYLYLFFTEFSIHIPLCHRPTWNMESTHPVLMKAMRVCGALFTKTLTAKNFIITTLTSSRDMLLLEFSKPTCTLKDHICLMLAVVLFQSIGLLQPRPEQRTSSRMYHDILVTMIRKTGLIKLIRSWSPPDLSDQASVESAWNDWARHETLKRTLVLAYLQDCSYCIYYSTAPVFLGLEIEINLPCDDALWKAQTSTEWYGVQRAPSPYGMGLARMLGTNMQFALTTLKDRGTSAVPYTVNPFASFILIHSILRDIFSTHNPKPTSGSSPHACMIGGINGVNTIMIECSLHKWQKMWSANPETMHSEKNSPRLPFVSNAIPFYWLARLAEAAKQDGTIHIGPSASTNEMENRYELVKTWLVEISSSLRTQVSPSLWNNNPTDIGLSLPFPI